MNRDIVTRMYNNIIKDYVDFRTKNSFEGLDDDECVNKSVETFNTNDIKIKKSPKKYSLVYDRYKNSKDYYDKLKMNKIIENKSIDKNTNNQYIYYKYQRQYNHNKYNDDEYSDDELYNGRYNDDYDDRYDYDEQYDYDNEIQDYYDSLGCDHKEMDLLLYSYGYYDNYDCRYDCNCYNCTRYSRFNKNKNKNYFPKINIR